VVIVGGGVTGLAAAYRLRERARATGAALRCTVLERAARPGGKIVTDRPGGPGGEWVVEGGPDSFVTRKPWALELIRELGLAGEVVGTRPAPHATYVLRRGRLVPLPAGLGLIAPTQWGPFLRSSLFSPMGRLRVVLEQWIPARRGEADETLAAFVRRRFGREALERLGEPLLAGIHNGVAERQSLLATFAHFREAERTHGSVIRGARRAARAAHATGGARTSPFVTLRGGMGTLIDALVAQLGDALVTGCGAAAIEAAGGQGAYRVRLDDGRVLDADALIVTTPAYAAADLVRPFGPELARLLGEIPYVSTGTVSLAYRRGDLGAKLDGFGVVIPRGEGRRINACTLSSLKFPHRAPGDHLLVRAFVGGTHRADLLDLTDDALGGLVREELREVLDIAAPPLWQRVHRWRDGNPQYNLGHLERVERLDALCPPGLILSGSAYTGVGIPDCVRQASEAAERVLQHLGPRRLAYA
jgi:oxygen-dependent protoporphyrinogen oxidase